MFRRHKSLITALRLVAYLAFGSALGFAFDHAWADFNGTQQLSNRYLFGDRVDEIVARQRSGEGVEVYLTDRLGSVHDRMNLAGSVTNSLRYQAFGGIAHETGSGDRFKFTGREFDSETGLYYYRARYFDPKLGRFLSEDPLGFEAGDSNLYRYVGNSPGNGVDPSGLQGEYSASLGISRGFLAGANAAALQQSIIAAVKLTAGTIGSLAAAEELARRYNIIRAVSTATDYGLDVAKQIGNSLLLATVMIDLATGQDVTTHVTPDGQITREVIIQVGGYTAVAQEVVYSNDHEGPVPRPDNLPGFPDAVRVRPKTPVQGGGGLRPRWKDKDGSILEWDSRHGELEKYDKRGRHQGSYDHKTGKKLKPRNDSRRPVEP